MLDPVIAGLLHWTQKLNGPFRSGALRGAIQGGQRRGGIQWTGATQWGQWSGEYSGTGAVQWGQWRGAGLPLTLTAPTILQPEPSGRHHDAPSGHCDGRTGLCRAERQRPRGFLGHPPAALAGPNGRGEGGMRGSPRCPPVLRGVCCEGRGRAEDDGGLGGKWGAYVCLRGFGSGRGPGLCMGPCWSDSVCGGRQGRRGFRKGLGDRA